MLRQHLDELVAQGLLRKVKQGHYALVQDSCRSCGARLEANAPRQRNGRLGYCMECRCDQLKRGWANRRAKSLLEISSTPRETEVTNGRS